MLVLIFRQAQDHRVEPILRRFSGVGTVAHAAVQWVCLDPSDQGGAGAGLALLNRLRVKRCEQRLGSLRASVMMEWLLRIAAVAAVSLLGTLPPMVMAG